VNPNHYAGLLEMLIPVAVLYIAERRGRSSLAALLPLAVGAAVAVASLLLSGSRGGLLALAAEALIALAVVGRRARHLGKRSWQAAVASTILAAVLLFAWIDPGIVVQHLGLIVKVGEPTWVAWVDCRKNLAFDSLRIFRDHPIAGVGLGNFETAYPPVPEFPQRLVDRLRA
jgi:O-antigen ligase